MIREELILQYLDKTITAEEAVLVQEWAAKNPSDFELIQSIWAVEKETADIRLFDTDEAWDVFMDSMDETHVEGFSEGQGEHVQDTDATNTTGESTAKRVSLWREWAPAAMAATALFAVISLYFLWPRDQLVTYLASAVANEHVLPDQTRVSLEEGSQIKYPVSFDQEETRTVYLDGIAVFDVVSDPSKPFIVQTSKTGVRAIGTIFEVNAMDTVQTGVKNIEGLIRFFELANEDKFIDVKEGESFVYDGSGFSETTPRPEPTILEFPAPTPVRPAIPYHTVREVVNYIYTISNGHVVPKGDDFDWQRKIQVDLSTINLDKILRDIQMKASVTLVKKDCSDCYEIRRFRVR